MSSVVRIALIFLVFALIHSVTVSRRFKNLCRDVLGDTFMRAFYRALYNVISVITVITALVFMAGVPDQRLWFAPGWLQWIMHGIQLAGLAFGALAFEHLDTWEFMGVRQAWRWLVRREVAGNVEGLTQKELVTTGVYGIVRHPMYLAGILVFTLNPHITVNSLTITVLADLYFLFGMFIEERRFIRIFGDQYREYMKRVPRLIPRLFPVERRRG
jgi:protein-S-isoprenylcysteine O-methyltransferase Ste14